MRIALLLALLGSPAGDGWTTLKAGDETVEVYRDAWGVPHIFAKTVRGAFWAEGYTEAEDRWPQMETYRRTGKGESAEIRGKEALKSDIDVRQHGYTEEERQKMFASMSERTRTIIQAYSDGVNAWLKENKIEARAWIPTDSIAVGVAMARRFGEAGAYELQIQQLYASLEKKHGQEKATVILHDLLRDSDPSAPATKHDHMKDAPRKEGGYRRTGAPMDPAIYEDYLRSIDEARTAREALGAPVYFGSNAWVVAPKKSKSGNAMLYGGPMMGFRTPSICNEVHLVAEGLDVGGMSFPGAPGILIGFNGSMAWTTTSGGADLVDVFTLELNDKGEYLYKGEWRAFEILEQEVRVKGGETQKIKVTRSVHGPIVGKIDEKNKRAHTMRYSFWMKESMTFDGVMDYNFARTLADFREASRKITTSHNFFVATSSGDIGFWYCGAHPRRKKDHDPRLPQKGDGSMDWEGLLAFEEWPQSVNPEHGFYANWNNKPARDWEPSAYGRIFWGKKIIDDLEAKEKLTFEEFQAIARRTAYHGFLMDYFGPHILAAARDCAEEDVKKAFELLSKWDRMETEGDPCPTIVERWITAMARRVFGEDIDPMILGSREAQRYLVDPLLYILDGERSAVKIKYDFVHGRDLKAMALESLKEALKPGWEKLAWREPSIGFGGKVGSLKSKKGRGTYQMTVEVTKNGPRAETLAAPGQNESDASKHYKDQAEMFEKWGYKKFLWRRDEMK